jgi:pSer/pThr/pTyr-binding forkhead associated (FHA) protein
MILCPNCNHQEVAGALFCSECGAQLVSSDPYKTQAINRGASDQLPQTPDESATSAPPIPANGIDAVVSLHLMDSGQILHLAGQNKFTLGRVLEGQPILPDVDLSPFDAYAQGVSRIHAALKIVNKQVFIVDLGSSNGTRVNGQKIAANTDFPLNHGDIVALGKLKIQVLIRR